MNDREMLEQQQRQEKEMESKRIENEMRQIDEERKRKEEEKKRKKQNKKEGNELDESEDGYIYSLQELFNFSRDSYRGYEIVEIKAKLENGEPISKEALMDELKTLKNINEYSTDAINGYKNVLDKNSAKANNQKLTDVKNKHIAKLNQMQKDEKGVINNAISRLKMNPKMSEDEMNEVVMGVGVFLDAKASLAASNFLTYGKDLGVLDKKVGLGDNQKLSDNTKKFLEKSKKPTRQPQKAKPKIKSQPKVKSGFKGMQMIRTR